MKQVTDPLEQNKALSPENSTRDNHVIRLSGAISLEKKLMATLQRFSEILEVITEIVSMQKLSFTFVIQD